MSPKVYTQTHQTSPPAVAAAAAAAACAANAQVAVYKDESGNVSKFSGLCPHLGCLLQWNPVEGEWNCPCHGSCFDKQGNNLAGPATIDMTKLSDSDV